MINKTTDRRLLFYREHDTEIKIIQQLVLLVVFGMLPLYAQETLPRTFAARDPININIIIDSSRSLSGVKDDVDIWLSYRLNEILAVGDRVTVWNAGAQSNVIYSGGINTTTDKESLMAEIRGIVPAADSIADLSGALKAAASAHTALAVQSGAGYSYTLLVTASFESLSSILAGPNANLLRYSSVEEFSA